jgi:hypothetical protein
VDPSRRAAGDAHPEAVSQGDLAAGHRLLRRRDVDRGGGGAYDRRYASHPGRHEREGMRERLENEGPHNVSDVIRSALLLEVVHRISKQRTYRISEWPRTI